jgi:2-hydroxy-3-keto-5-methylthiopentenyl-1-phosphate phosphatase
MIVFLDFDGTITRRDATDAILATYADPQWLRIEEEWKAGRIGSRQCLTAQMALVNATREEIDALLDDIEIDEGLVTLLATCATPRVPVHIVSDGFDYCIQRILSRPSLDLAPYLARVQIVSSHLEPHGRRWDVGFGQPCVHGCGTCKVATMARLNTDGGLTVFVGDGLSDAHAAAVADLVFAKDGLATYCDEQAIAYTAYDTLAAVGQRLLQSHTALVRKSSAGLPTTT